MTHLTLAEISTQLESENSKDRMLALAYLRDVDPQDAVPLIKKVLEDDVLQVRSMAVFALGVKPTQECFPILVKLMEADPDYGIRADAAGALGYLQDERALDPLNPFRIINSASPGALNLEKSDERLERSMPQGQPK